MSMARTLNTRRDCLASEREQGHAIPNTAGRLILGLLLTMGMSACSGLGKTCESQTYAVAPKPSSGWSAADDAFFVKRMCKHRSRLDLGGVDTPQERGEAGALMDVAVTVAHHRRSRDVGAVIDRSRFPATERGWLALLKADNQVPWMARQPSTAKTPVVRLYVSRVTFGTLRSPSQACVTIRYEDDDMPPGPKPFVQDHRFVKGDDGQWRFDGFEPDGTCLEPSS